MAGLLYLTNEEEEFILNCTENLFNEDFVDEEIKNIAESIDRKVLGQYGTKKRMSTRR